MTSTLRKRSQTSFLVEADNNTLFNTKLTRVSGVWTIADTVINKDRYILHFNQLARSHNWSWCIQEKYHCYITIYLVNILIWFMIISFQSVIQSNNSTPTPVSRSCKQIGCNAKSQQPVEFVNSNKRTL